jgi:hypothetical protein
VRSGGTGHLVPESSWRIVHEVLEPKYSGLHLFTLWFLSSIKRIPRHTYSGMHLLGLCALNLFNSVRIWKLFLGDSFGKQARTICTWFGHKILC